MCSRKKNRFGNCEWIHKGEMTLHLNILNVQRYTNTKSIYNVDIWIKPSHRPNYTL